MKSIDQARLDKELAAQKYRVEKLAIEAAAQKKKAEAIAHLESQGQRVEGVVGFQKKMAPKASDNTLNLLLGRKAVVIASEGEKVKEQLAKAALIKQQDESRRSRELKASNDNLPALWESVFDEASKSFYYWNRETNVTTWEKPETNATDGTETVKTETSVTALSMENSVSACVIEPEVAGWEEKVHPATQQKYYINIHSGERRATKPTAENSTARSSSSALPAISQLSKKRLLDTSSNNSYADMQRNSIDPLDVSSIKFESEKLEVYSVFHQNEFEHFKISIFLCSTRLFKAVSVEGEGVTRWRTAPRQVPCGSRDLTRLLEPS
jgi:WW domain